MSVGVRTAKVPDIVYIYALCDPDVTVRYVGKSNNPDQRFKAHLQPSSLKPNTLRSRWLRSLLRQGERPLLRILEVVPGSAWEEAERRWIAHYRPTGLLTNMSDGGECGAGAVKGAASAETRRKLSELSVARWSDPEYRRRAVVAMRTASHPNASAAARRRCANPAERQRLAALLASCDHPTRRGSRLTDQEVSEARQMKLGGMPLAAIAERFESSITTIHRAVTGQAWTEVPGATRPAKPRLTADQVRTIRERLRQGDRYADLAEQFGMSQSRISQINTGYTRKRAAS